MADTALLTTHDLELAVRVRDAFQEEGFRVELVTPSERIADFTTPALLVITGGLREKRARRLVREADSLGALPVLGLADRADAAEPHDCRRLGFTECLVKPVDPAEVALAGRRLVERQRLRSVTGIVGETEAMREVLARIVQIAPVNATVLITGESGTGKELVARGIHALSPRHDRRFVAANVAALPETLLESELFGHERGAFTGATAQRKGLFELADGGTLFLDEIGEMPPATQTKLLRVLEDRQFLRVGGEQPIRVDVRVITATNRDLRQLTELGDFRRDLYYRLNVLYVALPPLRQRRADIPLLVERFVHTVSQEHARPPVSFSPEALKVLVDYDWPGNVRELRNVIESIVVLAAGPVVRLEDLPDYVRSGSRRPALLPAPLPRREGERATAPELEFIFRTLLQLRLDIDDVRREFEEWRRARGEPPLALPYYPPGARGLPAGGPPIEEAELAEPDAAAGFPGFAARPAPLHGGAEAAGSEDDEDVEEGVVVYRPGKKMEDLEREAIVAALAEVAGNRRKAADLLGIGERTLYRKIKEYGIQA